MFSMVVAESQQCLLDETSYSEGVIPNSSCFPQRTKKTTRSWNIMFLLYMVLLHMILVAMPVLLIHCPQLFHLSPFNYNPLAAELSKIMQYPKSEDTIIYSESGLYTGSPNEQNNKAWNTITEPIYFNATEAEINLAIPSVDKSRAVQVADGGYLASLEVYHHLHCLKQLRMWVYKDTFLSVPTNASTNRLTQHLGHCINSLRHTIMCSPSLQVNFFLWRDDSSAESNLEKPFEPVVQQSKCVDWGAVDTWSRERKISTTPTLIRQARGE
ncbi:unnamed protein product [Periconia digitata]|uniref:Uncharacterized protein n=1 Tax=Periconia digitata TaxID=1303443 RepID=A0A9W4UAY6_9PLEO|nr:unnamed protein product [Periconia digitata]